MKAYYAHCKAIYKTRQEARDMATIQGIGFVVVNPADDKWADRWAVHGMDAKDLFAEECDLIIFRAIPHGAIPAGVAKEIEAFRRLGKPVLELPSMVSMRGWSVETTREYLSECGQR